VRKHAPLRSFDRPCARCLSDAISASRQKLESQISTLYGGRLAEEIIYGVEHVSTGASNDIKVATNLARNMVTQWGFSDKLGPLLYAEEEGEVFLGRSVAKAKHMSDETPSYGTALATISITTTNSAILMKKLRACFAIGDHLNRIVCL
jgi:ATP-dependent Zn protease